MPRSHESGEGPEAESESSEAVTGAARLHMFLRAGGVPPKQWSAWIIFNLGCFFSPPRPVSSCGNLISVAVGPTASLLVCPGCLARCLDVSTVSQCLIGLRGAEGTLGTIVSTLCPRENKKNSTDHSILKPAAFRSVALI